jgi:hypothetical protein
LRRWYTGYWQVVVCHRIPFGGQRIDAEFALLAIEALAFSILLLVIPLWALASTPEAAYYLVLDQALCFAAAAFVAVKQRRLDVLVWAPLFVVPRVLNAVLFLTTFIRIVVLRRDAAQWFSPPRYLSGAGHGSVAAAGGRDV